MLRTQKNGAGLADTGQLPESLKEKLVYTVIYYGQERKKNGLTQN